MHSQEQRQKRPLREHVRDQAALCCDSCCLRSVARKQHLREVRRCASMVSPAPSGTRARGPMNSRPTTLALPGRFSPIHQKTNSTRLVGSPFRSLITKQYKWSKGTMTQAIMKTPTRNARMRSHRQLPAAFAQASLNVVASPQG